MAMMKYGRTTKMTSPPDKVVKNKDGTTTTTSGNIAVTLSDWIQPEETPAPKGYISQDDYNAYEAKKKEVMDKNAAKYKSYNDAMAAYQQEQEDYKAGMDQYNRQIEYYKKGPGKPKSESGGMSITQGGKDVQGRDVTFSQDEEEWSAEKWNKLTDQRVKSGELVSLDDPSIDDTTRKLIKGTMLGNPGSDTYGKVDKLYVPKGTKYKSYKEIYGADFNPEEWEAENKKGPESFNKYLNSKGYVGKTFFPRTDISEHYSIPTGPNKPTSKMPVKPIIEEDPLPEKPKDPVWLGKLPTRKVLKIESTKKAEYSKMNENIEEGDWKDPTGGKFKHKGAIIPTAHAAAKGPEGAGGGKTTSIRMSPFSKKIGPDKGYGIQRGPGSGESKGLRAREEKMAKAFYSPESEYGHGGYYSKMEGTEGNIRKAIRSDIRDMRSERRDWKKDTSLKGAEKRSASREMFKEDIQTGRLSARYARRGDLKSLDTDPTNPDAGGIWKAGNKSKLKIYTPDLTKSGEAGAMDNYVASAEKNIEAARLYQENERIAKSNQLAADLNKEPQKIAGFVKSATDNAANRNTVIAQMEKYWKWGSKIK